MLMERNIIDKYNYILNVLAWVYCKKFKMKDNISNLQESAKKLLEDAFGENWLFIYEVLPAENLFNEWKKLKEKVSFIVL